MTNGETASPVEGQEGERKSIGIARVLALGVIYVLAYAVCAVPFYLAGKLSSAASTIVSQAVSWTVVIYLGYRMGRGSFLPRMGIRPIPKILIPAVIVASVGATIVLTQIAGLLPMPESIAERMMNIQEMGLLPLAVFVGVLAPIAEEVFFRGIVLQGFLARYSRTKAIWGSALLFAASHLNPWQAIIALPLGVGYAYLVLRTGSIIPGIISHSAINLFHNFVTPRLLQLWDYSQEELERLRYYPYQLLLLGVVVLAVGLAWTIRETGKRSSVEDSSSTLAGEVT
jgi:membrane protease YdiL (CAAX protease family)